MPASERRSAPRTAVVWEALEPVLAAGSEVLDVGGGTGGFAVRVAALGNRVRVVDPSPDALAALARRADEHGVADRITSDQGDLSSVLELAGRHSTDLVLCHGVLEMVEDPATALGALAEVLRPGGYLSLLVAQRHAAVIGRAMAGSFQQARAMLDSRVDESTGRRRFVVDEITALLADAGFRVDAMHGIRVFADLVPESLLDAETGALASLVDLERAVAERPEFFTIAAQIHVLARH